MGTLMTSTAPVLHFRDVGLGDVPTVGGKGASLGELLRAGIRVPTGLRGDDGGLPAGRRAPDRRRRDDPRPGGRARPGRRAGPAAACEAAARRSSRPRRCRPRCRGGDPRVRRPVRGVR